MTWPPQYLAAQPTWIQLAGPDDPIFGPAGVPQSRQLASGPGWWSKHRRGLASEVPREAVY